IYGIEEVDERLFIEMEYVDGITLRRKLTDSPLNVDDALSYGIQIGEALQEAHSKGIVHRDIKSDNVMLNSRNQVKVMDFGLAKLKGSLKLTRTTSTVGTLAYMSPEQIQGGAADMRSDIFSFGVVLYEMLTQKFPFRGEHEAAMMYSIVNEPHEPVQKHRLDATADLIHIIDRLLEKNPADRYQSIGDVVIELRRLKRDTSKVYRTIPIAPATPPSTVTPQVTPPPAQQPSPTTTVMINIPRLNVRKLLIPLGAAALLLIVGVAGYFLFLTEENGNGERLPVAVADFVNETGEKELDGLSGMLITSLEQSKRLSVLTRSRMFDVLRQLGRANVDRVDESLGRVICQQAGVNALVLASVRKFGKLYTIDLKILDPRENQYLFAASEQGEGQESIPGMIDELSKKTRVGLKEKEAEVKTASTNVAGVTTANLQAYQHYFQGEQLINKLKFDEAQEEFKKAIALDSTFGLAYYRLAYAINWLSGSDASAALNKALALKDRLPERERYLLQALNAEAAGGFAAGVTILREMEKAYPDDKEMIYNIGDWSYHAGDFSTAVTYLEKVLAIDPSFERGLQ
ncbi:MAG: protein kinase domain-containing protein, partial [Bacteroidota bacterium]